MSDNIDDLVRRKIDELDKSPRIIRSTALIIKTSRAPAKKSTNKRSNGVEVMTTRFVGLTPINNLFQRECKITSTPYQTTATATSTMTTTNLANGNSKILHRQNRHPRQQVSYEDTTDFFRSAVSVNGLESSISTDDLSNPTKTANQKFSVTTVNGYASLISTTTATTTTNHAYKSAGDLRNGTIGHRKRLLSENDNSLATGKPRIPLSIVSRYFFFFFSTFLYVSDRRYYRRFSSFAYMYEGSCIAAVSAKSLGLPWPRLFGALATILLATRESYMVETVHTKCQTCKHRLHRYM